MASDKNEPPTGYIPIRDYFEALMKMTQRAIDIASAEAERRFKDFPEQFVKKGDIGEILSKLSSKVEQLEKANIKVESKADLKALEIVRWVSIASLMVSIIGITLGLILRFFKV